MSTGADRVFDWRSERIIVTGGTGFLGGAVCRAISARGPSASHVRSLGSRDADLTDRNAARRVLRESFGGLGPTAVVHCAGAIGGLQANLDEPGRFFFENAAMAMNLIEEFRLAGLIEKGAVFVQIGSMTSYPADAPVPFRERDLWRGYPDSASAPYAVAKLAAWQMLDAYATQYGMRSAYLIPVNLYGPGDNIDDPSKAHVAGTLVRRFVDAAGSHAGEVVCWGDGSPTRDFLYIDDAAEGVVSALERVRTPLPINLGSGTEISIRDLAEMIARLSGFGGSIRWDSARPGGQARRCMDVSRAQEVLQWEARTTLEDGLRRTIDWYRSTLK